VFNSSRSTYLSVRKDAYVGKFCIEEAVSVRFADNMGFRLGADPLQRQCTQKGFSLAPSSTNASVPAPGANIWLSGAELSDGIGKMVASGFEGFAAGQAVETEVPGINFDELWGADPIQRIDLKNGPYKMAFNKAFDAANFLRFEGSTKDTYVVALCLYGKYSA
jgi:hypothetical protein